MFNNNEVISTEEIFKALPDISKINSYIKGQAEIAGSLIAFCTMKEQETLLKKSSEARSIKKDDKFVVN
jgi:hypothetical protein